MNSKIEISEDKLSKAIEIYRKLNSEEPYPMIKALENGEIYRKEGLSPTFIMDSMTGTITSTSEEFLDGKFN